MGSYEQFAAVARLFREAGFNEGTICRAFGLGDMSDVGRLTSEDVARADISRELSVLVQLFLVLVLVPRPEVEQALDAESIKSLAALGLLVHDDPGDNFYSPVLLYPVDGFVIASDRLTNADGSSNTEMPDIVFPAIYRGTIQFLRLLPAAIGGDALDLCAGTGIGAFALSRDNKRACSVDITRRASEYARFNNALNGCDNVEVLQGDLYEPVKDRMFDCIVAHPPYVPSVSVDTFWRDGGAIGDIFIKRIVEQMPAYLRVGGYALILAQGVDTREGKFEQRARRWLGESAPEFDIIFASEKERGPQKVLELLGKDSPFDVIERLREAFEAADVVSMPYGALFIRRVKRSTDEAPWTIRAQLSSETTGADFQSTFTLHDSVSRPDFAEQLTHATPRLGPYLEVQVTHVVHEGALAPADYIFFTNRPFAKRVRMDDWATGLFMRFDGKATVAEVYDASRADSDMPPGFAINDFLLLVTRSIEAGFLVLPDTDCPVSWTR